MLGWLRPVTGHLALQTRANVLGHLWHTLRWPAYQTGLLATLLLTFGGGLLAPFRSTFLLHNVLLPAAQLPLIHLFTGLSSLVVMPLAGRLSDRVSRFTLFAAGSGLAIGAVLAYTHLGPAPLWQVVLLNVVLFIGIMSRLVPAMALNTSLPGPADRGAYLSLTSSMQQLGGGLAAVAAGLLVPQATLSSPLRHFPLLGYVAAASFMLGVLFVYRVSQLVAHQPVADSTGAEVAVLAATLAE